MADALERRNRRLARGPALGKNQAGWERTPRGIDSPARGFRPDAMEAIGRFAGEKREITPPPGIDLLEVAIGGLNH